ncbi:hypothetical protein RRF57_011676 [Xylaria bambusicola]|uniref:Uncharacterized protein n=1 Tax=Xylaria bambusicola TaxID=326684 RepID=A0AAN7UX25_9PEZI
MSIIDYVDAKQPAPVELKKSWEDQTKPRWRTGVYRSSKVNQGMRRDFQNGRSYYNSRLIKIKTGDLVRLTEPHMSL